MFVVSLTYCKPLADVDRFIEGHREFLAKHYASGVFLLSGRKEPRTGGVILANCPTQAHLERVLGEDPFWQHGIARYDITEFIPSMGAPQFSAFLSDSGRPQQ
jgi:uncharacterized protein YciI